MNRQERDATSVTVFTAPLVSFIRIGPSVNESQRIIDRKPSFSRPNVESLSLFSHIEFHSYPSLYPSWVKVSHFYEYYYY